MGTDYKCVGWLYSIHRPHFYQSNSAAGRLERQTTEGLGWLYLMRLNTNTAVGKTLDQTIELNYLYFTSSVVSKLHAGFS